ncbi:hypothetical protein TWF281_000144 [Arthrobotrys megalospora]
MSPETPKATALTLREFRPGPVIGGILAGLLGLAVAIGIALFLDKKFRRKKATENLKAEADDAESGRFSVSTCAYDDRDSDTLYSPTETSPALRPVREKLSKKEFELSEKEAELAVEQGALPPPFPVYKEMSI